MNWTRLRFMLKQWLHRPAPKPPAAPLALSHPMLGELAGTVDELNGSVALQARLIPLSIRRDDQTMESALALAEQVAAQLPALHDRSLQQLVEHSLASYNEGWRFGQTVGADGKAVDFEKPPLSAAEFCAQFTLTSVEASGLDLVALWYDCGDLFWGHAFCVTSFDGVSGELHAEMLG